MRVREWTDAPPEPTPVRPAHRVKHDGAHNRRPGARLAVPPSDQRRMPPTAPVWIAKPPTRTAAAVLAPRWTAGGTISRWPLFVLLCAALFVVLVASYQSPERNDPVFNVRQIVGESGLSVDDICSYRGGPITSLTEIGDYGGGLVQYQATCAGNGMTPTFMVDN